MEAPATLAPATTPPTGALGPTARSIPAATPTTSVTSAATTKAAAEIMVAA